MTKPLDARAAHTPEQMRTLALACLRRIETADGPESRSEIIGQCAIVELMVNGLHAEATKRPTIVDLTKPVMPLARVIDDNMMEKEPLGGIHA
jgi:hypothetical protein